MVNAGRANITGFATGGGTALPYPQEGPVAPADSRGFENQILGRTIACLVTRRAKGYVYGGRPSLQ